MRDDEWAIVLIDPASVGYFGDWEELRRICLQAFPSLRLELQGNPHIDEIERLVTSRNSSQATRGGSCTGGQRTSCGLPLSSRTTSAPTRGWTPATSLSIVAQADAQPSNHTNGSPPRVRSRRTSLCAPKVRKPWLYTVWSHLLYADSCVLGLFFVCSVCLHLLCHHPATLQQSVCVVLAVFFYRRQRCAGGVPRGVVPR